MLAGGSAAVSCGGGETAGLAGMSCGGGEDAAGLDGTCAIRSSVTGQRKFT